MSQEIDFEQLIDLLDRALTSKDPKVISALKKFLFIAALATEEAEETGPFGNLLEEVERLKLRVSILEQSSMQPYKRDWIGTPGGSSPTFPQWYYGTGTSTSGTFKTYDMPSSGYTTVTSSNLSEKSTADTIDKTIEELKKLSDDAVQSKK